MKNTKTETVALRLTAEEKTYLQEQAKKADMTVSKYLYKIIFSKDEENQEE